VDADRLTHFEYDVIATILRPDHPVFDALRRQLAACRVGERELTGHGFYTSLIVPPDVAPAPVNRDQLRLDGGIGATMDGLQHGAGFVLWVQKGVLDTLEGFCYEAAWPERIENWAIMPVTVHRGEGSETDLEQVENSWDRRDETDIVG
jgi:hypothetical protein